MLSNIVRSEYVLTPIEADVISAGGHAGWYCAHTHLRVLGDSCSGQQKNAPAGHPLLYYTQKVDAILLSILQNMQE